jgi:DNA-binding transcriptional MerR regulator
MSHEIAKLLLEHSGILERSKVIQEALNLGMPLHEIEEYLDWIDSMKQVTPSDQKPDSNQND